jgi:hypothetical protein
MHMYDIRYITYLNINYKHFAITIRVALQE